MNSLGWARNSLGLSPQHDWRTGVSATHGVVEGQVLTGTLPIFHRANVMKGFIPPVLTVNLRVRLNVCALLTLMLNKS
ncbi:hypothetical protein [Pseudomonas endophytica]|uniref:hypothetical protein n=1 Tax=Pseudomonas endophytica TaxID=1563157 RepID=UPI0012E2FA73|nr:hypothetical protein [Pseudomonas endophytica]